MTIDTNTGIRERILGLTRILSGREINQRYQIYREQFRPSEVLWKPYLIMAVQVIAAETDVAARWLFTIGEACLFREVLAAIVPNENPVRHSSGRRCRRNHESHEGLCHVFEAVKRIQRGECEQFRQRFQKTH
jgi:hypothetical protein